MTKASEIPPATADRPVTFGVRDAFERADDAHDGAEQSDERSRGADGGETGKAALHFGVHDGDGAFEAALGSFDHFFIVDLRGSRLEFGEARRDNLGDVALLVALGDGDRFVELVVLQRAGDLLHENAGLLARRAVHQRTVDHDAHRPRGHNEQNDHNDLGRDSPCCATC